MQAPRRGAAVAPSANRPMRTKGSQLLTSLVTATSSSFVSYLLHKLITLSVLTCMMLKEQF